MLLQASYFCTITVLSHRPGSHYVKCCGNIDPKESPEIIPIVQEAILPTPKSLLYSFGRGNTELNAISPTQKFLSQNYISIENPRTSHKILRAERLR